LEYIWVFHLLSLSFTFFRIHDQHSYKPTAFHTIKLYQNGLFIKWFFMADPSVPSGLWFISDITLALLPVHCQLLVIAVQHTGYTLVVKVGSDNTLTGKYKRCSLSDNTLSLNFVIKLHLTTKYLANIYFLVLTIHW